MSRFDIAWIIESATAKDLNKLDLCHVSRCFLFCIQEGQTALIKAAVKGHLSIVMVLLNCGASTAKQTEATRGEGREGAPIGERSLCSALCVRL